MKTLIFILLLVLPQQELEYKRGRPTSRGVDKYVEANEYQFIIDYQNHVGDTLVFEPFISADDLSDYVGFSSGEAGFFERPDNVVIHNRANYIDYELRLLSRFRKSQYREANKFVRGVVMHELTHAYIYQIQVVQGHRKQLEYEWRQGLRMLPVDNYYTEFIEEGISEYVAADMQEIIPYDQEVILIKKDLSSASRNTYEIKYRYAMQFVTPVIREYGLKPAIELIMATKPPSREELLAPSLYYNRLRIYRYESGIDNNQ